MELLIGTTKGLFTLDGPSAFEGRTVTALSFDGADLWALVDGREVWRRRAGWTIVATLDDLDGSCIVATPSTVLVGTESAHLLELREDTLALIDPFESAPGRSNWYTPWGGPPAVRSLAAADGVVYVNVHVGGILRTTDLRTFEPTIDIDTDVHEVSTSGRRVYAALGDEGVASSTDGGGTWRIQTEGLHGSYVRAVRCAGDVVLITASSGPFARDGAVYRDAGEGFERCTAGIPDEAPGNVDTGWLTTAGDAVAVAMPDGAVYRSMDAGATWERVAEGMPEPQWLVFA